MIHTFSPKFKLRLFKSQFLMMSHILVRNNDEAFSSPMRVLKVALPQGAQNRRQPQKVSILFFNKNKRKNIKK